MHKRKILPLCIAMALSSNAWATDTDDVNDSKVKCPTQVSQLTEAEKAALPAECKADDDSLTGWVLGGAAAVAAAIGVAMYNDNGGGYAHHDNHSPAPPDDGGDSGTLPDDGGDSGTLPDDGGDSGTNPDDGGDSGTDPDDGGDSGTDPVTGTYYYDNGVTLDTDANTLTFDTVSVNGESWDNVTFNYVEEGDNYVLTAPDGRTLVIDKKYVTDENNAVIDGTYGSDDLSWKYDSTGTFWFADADTNVIAGDGEVTSLGDTTTDGENRIGTLIIGDNTETTLEGDTTASNGAIGVVVSGDDTLTTNNGDIYASGGATGLYISGYDNQFTNVGSITAVDDGSTGVIINGDLAHFSNEGNVDSSLNATGVSIAGNGTGVLLDGTVNVHAEKDADGVYQGGTGVSVAGNNGVTEITGDVNISGSYAATDSGTPQGTLTGVAVSGENNTVLVDGALSIALDTQVPGNTYFEAQGVTVTGSGNTVQLNGGVDISTSIAKNGVYSNEAVGILIDGDNTLSVSGDSSLNIAAVQGGWATFASVNNGGHLVLNADSTLGMAFTNVAPGSLSKSAVIEASGEGSTVDNYGVITGDSFDYALMKAASGAQVTNHGTVNSQAKSATASWGTLYATQGGTAINADGGTVNLTSTLTPGTFGSTSMTDVPIRQNTHVGYAMLADFSSTASMLINEAGGTINLQGAGLFGMGAVKGTATNAGTINLDGFIPVLNEDGSVASTSLYNSGNIKLHGAGMVMGSDSTGVAANASGVNTGTINVNNEGIGMLALHGGTVTNQGTINLTADEGVTGSMNNQLVGMMVAYGGTAINDKDGVINIDADYGQAFATDGSGLIINYGKICADDVCTDAETYNPTDSAVATTYEDGDVIAAAGTSTALSGTQMINGNVSNDGSVSGGTIIFRDTDTTLTNQAGGTISSGITQTTGTLNNAGTITSRAVVSGGTVNNTGTMEGVALSGSAAMTNSGELLLGSASSTKYDAMVEVSNTAQLVNTGSIVLDNKMNALHLNNAGTIDNQGTLTATASSHSGVVNFYSGSSGMFKNSGTVDVSGVSSVVASQANAATGEAFFWNDTGGTVNFDQDDGKAVNFSHSNYVAENDGTLNVSGNNAVGMYGDYNSQLVNNGTINLGTEGSTDTGLIAMQLGSKATADAVIENNGTININTSDSYAFSNLSSSGHIVNNGTVVFAEGVTGSALIAADSSTAVEGLNGNDGTGTEAHYASYTLPGSSATSTSATNDLTGYVVGTSADGSAGTLMVSNASMNGVSVNTGFTAGTDATSVTFDNVVQGSNLTDASAIASTSVVWNAQGSTDASGNVDVTMSKNAYADVATDGSVSSVANALDAGYTNNEQLYSSLNVGSQAELNSALKQVSGSQATNVFRQARVLSNRFDMLADAAPQVGNGLAFNVVAKGDQRAQLDKNTDYDMLALRQTLDLTGSQNLTMEYGIARLDGNGSQSAGNNGITGGYSQFFGLNHQMAFENGVSWNNGLRYDVHNLDSNRSVAYGDVSKSADSSAKQQYLEFRSEGAKKFELSEALTVTPYAGVKLRHTLEDGYQERNAGDFNLNMNSGSETAVDSIVGMKVDYAGKDGWSATATLEGGPNLSYAKSQRSATVAGAGNQRFAIDDGQTGGGVNHLATTGVKYSGKDSALQLDAYHWKEDGVSDKGLMLNFKKTF